MTRWVDPSVVAEVEFRAWTADGMLRHAAFKGVREDKPAGEVVAESVPLAAAEPAPAPAEVPARLLVRKAPASRGRAAGEPANNVQRLLPDALVPTREALEAYWRRVGKAALAHLGRRPLTLVRHEGGRAFFHQGPLPPLVQGVRSLPITKSDGEAGVRLWVDSVEGLLGLVAMGVVEVHPWGASVDDIERADVLVFDLDPGEGVAWEFVTDTALRLRERLAAEGFEPWPKLTGGKGLHVTAPVAGGMPWSEARAFTRAIAAGLAASDPERYTTAAALAKRRGRLFLDTLRNGRGATAVGAFSPRARPGFPVAAPVTWRDVERAIRPDAFSLARPPSGPRRR